MNDDPPSQTADVEPIETVEGEPHDGLISSSHWQLRCLVERIERLDGEIAEIRADRADIRKEAKSNGFDLKALDWVLRRRKLEPQLLDQLDALVETYECALGTGRPGLVDGGDLGRLALPPPGLKLSKDAKTIAEADAWADGLGR